MSLTVERLAKALCQSAGGFPSEPHSHLVPLTPDQQPCKYHLSRAAAVVSFLLKDAIPLPPPKLPKIDPEAERSRLFAENHRLRHQR